MSAIHEVLPIESIETQIDQTTNQMRHHRRIENIGYTLAGFSFVAAAAAVGSHQVAEAANIVSFHHLTEQEDAIKNTLHNGWAGVFTGPLVLIFSAYHNMKGNFAEGRLMNLEKDRTVALLTSKPKK